MATSGSNLSLWLHKSWTFISEENISWFVFFLLLSELALEVSPRRRRARGGGGGRGGVVRGQRERRVPVAESKNILIIKENISKTTYFHLDIQTVISYLIWIDEHILFYTDARWRLTDLMETSSISAPWRRTASGQDTQECLNRVRS